jgi:hypothetical protein
MKLDLCTLTWSDSWMISGSVGCVVSSVTGSVADAEGDVITGDIADD